MIIPEILWRHADYVGCVWKHSGDPDDYSTLEWDDGNTVAKPTEATLTSQWAGIKEIMMLEQVRAKRDELIAETDWQALSDTTTMTTEQTNYRQALRDITSDTTGWDLDEYGKVTGVTWPTAP